METSYGSKTEMKGSDHESHDYDLGYDSNHESGWNPSSRQGRRDYDGGHDLNNNENSASLREELSRKETKLVHRFRWNFLGIILAVSVSISYGVYFITSYAEQQEFNSEYEGASSKLISCFDRFIERMGIVNSIGVAATAYGLGTTNLNSSSNSTFANMSTTSLWPFVTIPHFTQSAASARELSKSLLMSIHPKVDDISRPEWEKYVANEKNMAWIKEGIDFLDQEGLGNMESSPKNSSEQLSILEKITNVTKKSISFVESDESTPEFDEGAGPFLPKWQTSPVLKYDTDINVNLLHENMAAKYCMDLGLGVFGESIKAPPGPITSENTLTSKMATLKSISKRHLIEHGGALVTNRYLPIFDSFLVSKRQTVGVLRIIYNWRTALENVLPIQHTGIYAVVENTCSGNFTFFIRGPNVDVVGMGDLHSDVQYSIYHRLAEFDTKTMMIQDGTPDGGIKVLDNWCTYRLHLYPSQEFAKVYLTKTPLYATLAVVLAFTFVISLFCLYDRLVEVRQHNILNKAAQSTALVSTLFPKKVRDRLLNFDELNRVSIQDNSKNKFALNKSGSRLKAFLKRSSDENNTIFTELQSNSGTIVKSSSCPTPIADLFHHCTVMFTDIVGFTAWSSIRGPEQVFILLQTLFHGFDQAAKRRKVFKVETIGDCYVAVTGLPEPQSDHAVLMVRFAMDCKLIMAEKCFDLQRTLGPDCSDLQMRIGLHSGPVTAGVLVGDRARFQLFGDTVNTASRIESTGMPNKIHASQSTADILIESRKEHWIKRRDDLVEAKGKGCMQTYWVSPGHSKRASNESSTGDRLVDNSTSETVSDNEKLLKMDESVNRINQIESMKHSGHIGWFVEIFSSYIEKVIRKTRQSRKGIMTTYSTNEYIDYKPSPGIIALDEIKDVIDIIKPDNFDKDDDSMPNDVLDDSVVISDELLHDIHDFVSIIATLHGNNAFHNFEHAAHVTISAQKLLNHLLTPDQWTLVKDHSHNDNNGEPQDLTDGYDLLCLHRISNGFNSNPIAQLAIVFAAMIHDVDHRGCSNVQLTKEEAQMAAFYQNKSIAEQNSVDIAWSLLMSKQFDRLRKILFAHQDDMLHFRQILVNAILSTDIGNRELNEFRRKQWEKAYSSTRSKTSSSQYESANPTHDEYEQLNLKATIAIELILQASNIAPTMQHWHVYLKWNKRLFHESYKAYLSGRLDEPKNPALFWYEEELIYFDRVVIPLAQKLNECQLFGSSSEEYLMYAVSNKNEWKEKGQKIVHEFVNEFL